MMRLMIAALVALLAPPAQAQKLDETPRTVVMTAFKPEWDALVPLIAEPKEHAINGRIFLTGTFAGKKVILMQSGVSVVNAAMNTQLVLDRFTVSRIVFSGIAGGVDPRLGVGDVVVPTDWGQYLETAFARKAGKGAKGDWAPPALAGTGALEGAPANWYFIFPRGTMVTNAATAPRRLFRIPVDPGLLTLARSVVQGMTLERCVPRSEQMRAESQLCLQRPPRLDVGGTGVTAGVFADNKEFRLYLQKAWSARVLDMESAAVMQVAYSNMVPAIVFRSISDLAGADRHKNVEETFAHLASVNSAKVVQAFVAALPN